MLPDSSTAKRYGAFTAAIGLTLLCAASLSSTPPTDADNLLLDAATSGGFTHQAGSDFDEESADNVSSDLATNTALNEMSHSSSSSSSSSYSKIAKRYRAQMKSCNKKRLARRLRVQCSFW